MSEEELEDKLEKGDFSVFTQRASIGMFWGILFALLHYVDVILYHKIW